MAKSDGYRAEKSPNSGRFRKGHQYKDREGTFFGGWNYMGHPSKEAYLAAKAEREAKKEKEAKRMARADKIAADRKDLQDIARDYTEESMKIAAEIMRNENEVGSVRLQAIQLIQDRGFGKPTVTQVNTNLNADVKPKEVNAEELDTRIAEALNRVEKLTRREAEAPESEERPVNLRQYN